MYSVILEASAQEFYARVQPALAKKLARCFAVLEQTPSYHPNIKPLKDNYAGCYRYRAGDYRVVYYIDDEQSQVNIVTITHRSEAYE